VCSRKQETEKLENEKKAEKERQEAIERQARRNCQKQDDDRRQRILDKLQEIQQREIKESLKVIIVGKYCIFVLKSFEIVVINFRVTHSHS